MLSVEDNKKLTETSAGTLMGELLRRYWMPVGAVAELDDNPTKQIRLMGEDLVIYKDKSGTYGLVDLHCPHRRADLSEVDDPQARRQQHHRRGDAQVVRGARVNPHRRGGRRRRSRRRWPAATPRR